MSRLLLYSLAATLLWIGPGDRQPEGEATGLSEPMTVVDHKFLDYEEDGGTKVVAEIEGTLESNGAIGRLVLRARAQGDRVEPAVGLRGVWGHNRHTAAEMLSLTTADQLRFVIETAHGESSGTVRTTRRARLRERRIWDSGRIDHFARTEGVFPVELEFAADGLPLGVSTADLMVKGEPRLRAVVEVTTGGGRIVELVHLDTHLAEEVQGW